MVWVTQLGGSRAGTTQVVAPELTFLSRIENRTQVLAEMCCVTQGSSWWSLGLELGRRSPDTAQAKGEAHQT